MSAYESTEYDNLGVSGVEADDLLESIKDDAHWVCWQYQCRGCWTIYHEKLGDCPDAECDGQVTKVPVNPDTGSMAKSNDSSTWSDFSSAREYDERSGETQGIGFMFAEDHPVMGVDLDNAIIDGELTEWAEEIVDKLDGSYIDISPSGTGLHGLSWGVVPDGGSRKKIADNDSHEYDDPGEVEMYDSGRYFTVTFDHLEGSATSLNYQQPAIEEIHEKFIVDDSHDDTSSSTSSPSESNLDLDEEEILEKAKGNDEKFRRLWNGDISDYKGSDGKPDHSRADMALASKLAFWTQKDEQMMDSLFRESGLMRPKWKAQRGDQTYGEMTLEKAIRDTTDVYDPEFSSDDSRTEDDTDHNIPDDADLTVKDGKYGRMSVSGDIEDGDADVFFDEVTNFTMSRQEILNEDGEQYVKIKIDPANGASHTETVSPTVFNEPRAFKNAICTRLSTSFSGSSLDLPELRRIVLGQESPSRVSTTKVGLHDGEFVTPDTTFSSDDEYEYTYRDTGSSFAAKWNIDEIDYDEDVVRETLELLPEIRDKERWLPVIGFYYGALFAPLIREWEGELPSLSITGESGSGKSSSMSKLSQAFGLDGTAFSADTTHFSLMKHLSATTNIPIWYDEYKPTEIKSYRLDSFHSLLRSATNGRTETRGTQNASEDVYELEAPVAITGEQQLQGSAEQRRSILTQFRAATTDPDTDTYAAFDQFSQLDLEHHAMYVVDAPLDIVNGDEMDLETVWDNSQQHVRDVVDESLGDLAVNGLAMIQFGTLVYITMCRRVGASPDINDDMVDDAIQYVAAQKGTENRTTHMDEFLTQVIRCMDNNTLQSVTQTPQRGDYKIINLGDDDEELRLKLNRVYPEVNKYLKDYNIDIDLLGPEDYKDRFRDMESNDNTYIVDSSKQTRGLNRCVAVDTNMMAEKLDVDLEDIRQDEHRSQRGDQ